MKKRKIFIKPTSESVRFTGRWDVTEEKAVTTASGGMIEAAWYGRNAVLYFDTWNCEAPYPHIWLKVDGGAKIQTAVCKRLRIETDQEKEHRVEIIYKGSSELQHRWYQPLVGRLGFLGIEAEAEATLPEDDRRVIEFIGDSITEGILVDANPSLPETLENRPYVNDATASYAYLTALALGMKPVICGYGGVGVVGVGCASVPKAPLSYPYNFDTSHYHSQNPDIVVINHGANDYVYSSEEYTDEYVNLIKVVREINPSAKIVVLSAFIGVYPNELKIAVEKYNRENNENVYFIDSAGWVPREPLHPLRDSHKIIADKLTNELKVLGII